MALAGHGISSHYGKPDCGSNSSSIDRPGARGWTEARDMELSATFHGSLNSPATGKAKLVDANADGKISEAEFKDGCKNGLVQEASAGGQQQPSGKTSPMGSSKTNPALPQ